VTGSTIGVRRALPRTRKSHLLFAPGSFPAGGRGRACSWQRPGGPRTWSRRLAQAAACTVAALLLGACTVGPRYSRPSTPAPPAYKEMPENWRQAQPADQVLRGKWWEIYQDPQLNGLEEKISLSSQTLKAAQAQFAQARALLRQSRADYYPTVTAGIAASRSRVSANRPLRPPSAPVNSTDLVLPADVAYEPDVWGRVRRSVEAARAHAQASAADLESVGLSLHAELAIDYFQARTLDAEAQLLDSTVSAYEKALQLTQHRYQVDVAQAQAQLETTRAQATDLRVQRAGFEHAIAVLMGEPASTFSLPPAALNPAPPVTPPGLPSDLLERRPDIAAAERRVAAANAGVGIARSAYFPALSLTASGGFEGTTISNWLSGPSGFAAVGISALETAFDAGRRRAISDQAKAAYDQSVADYRQNLLTAFREVEDNLAALRLLEVEAKTQNTAVAAAEHSLALSNNRYRGGVATYLEVITAQSLALVDERIAVEISGRRMVDSVLLIKALGGGWNSATLSTVQNPPLRSAPTGQ
jgi:NodT family efflux transporter outer membrane factor (OMF) lipoprotein